MAKLIIISGAEATGKSAIRDELASRLKIDYLSKDVIKEKMFDTETVSTWNFSWYDNRARQELFHETKDYLAKDSDFIIEANFKSADEAGLKDLIKQPVAVYEIFCFTRGFTSFKRFVGRNENGLRHRGHHDRRWYLPVFIYSLCGTLKIKWPYKPMKLSDKLLYLNTTDLAKIDYDSITEFISSPV